MQKKRILVLSGPGLLLAAVAWGAISVPVVVSPGSSNGVSVVADRCPTFSWGSVPGAHTYELVVYRLAQDQVVTEKRPTLRMTIPGSASSWTPTVDRCLNNGVLYAWSLRASDKKSSSPWSDPVLIEIHPGPTIREVEEALDMLERYLGRERPQSLSSGLSEAQLTDLSATTLRDIQSETEPESALAAGFAAGIVSELTETGVGTIGVNGMSHSPVAGSSGVLGESLAIDGQVAGVKGTSASFAGWGGYFQNYFPALFPTWGTGLFAGGGPGFGNPPILSSDLVLGGWGDIGGGVIDDKGTIATDPRFASSDLILFSNDEARIHLNIDGDSEVGGSWFTIFGGLTEVFKIDHSGNAFVRENLEVTGNLTLVGIPGGNLVSRSDVDAKVESAVARHESAYHPLKVFATSTTYTGNLGGVTGADQECQDRAWAAGLEGTFIAWISTEASDANERLTTRSSRAYWLPNGTKVVDNWDDLVNCTPTCLDHAIDRDEFGNALSGTVDVWTRTKTNGAVVPYDAAGGVPADDCGNWGSPDQFTGGWTGWASHADKNWTDWGNKNCAQVARLYCFQN